VSAKRQAVWAEMERDGEPWDLLVIGGGITGAGLLREAVHAGLKTLLVERRDFAWGTSSRSSKLVHGGLRYLKEGRLKLVAESVRERTRLFSEAPGLVETLPFLLASYQGDSPGPLAYGTGLALYDMLALRWDHRWLDAQDVLSRAPKLSPENLAGGFRYADAETDDARLVLRLVFDAVAAGGVALNYCGVEELLRDGTRVAGAVVRDGVTGATARVKARAVVNATGVFTDRLRAQVGAAARMRPLRGSHLVFRGDRLPAEAALAFLHPRDRRFMFVIPWEGVTLVGTTDLDHTGDLDEEPSLQPEEATYLMEAVSALFPSARLTRSDVIASYSGLRPVVGTGRLKPSEEPRDHVIWDEEGLVTVTGGKLTTFRIVARQTLETLRRRLPRMRLTRGPLFPPAPRRADLPEPHARRLNGRYGAAAPQLLSRPAELAPVPGTPVLWAELRHGARAERVVRLEDLMLRRTRLGLLLPEGGAEHLPRVERICREELGWDARRWREEQAAYRALWRRCYGPPS